MIDVKVCTPAPAWPWKRQLPRQCNEWGPFRFHIDTATPSCDAWVVFEGLAEETTVACPPDRLVFMTGEPNSIGRYHGEFLAQFSHVVTGNRALEHPQVVHLQQGHPWFVERTLDELLGMQPIPKPKEICLIVSNKAFTPGHERRLKFVEALKDRMGDRLDVFGRGIRDFDSKWDVLSQYRYTVVLENAQEPDFLTEKLPDAWLAYCFPFYVGCPNVDRYFGRGAYELLDIDDPDGSVGNILRALADPQHYAGALPAVAEARDFYLRNYQFFPNLAMLLQSILGASRRGPQPVTLLPASHFFRKDDQAAAPGVLQRFRARARRLLSRHA